MLFLVQVVMAKTLTPLYSIARNSSQIDYYKDENKRVLGVTNRLIVKLKDQHYLEEVLKKFQLKMERELGRNLYLLQTSDKKFTLEISKKLNMKDFIEYAHPDFIKKTIKR